MKSRLLLAALVLATVPVASGVGKTAPPPPSGIQYVTVDDGTEIAVQVFYPDGYVEGNTYPALVEMEGYGGAAAPNDNTYVGHPNYIVVAISMRGTGCSGGTLELFSDRSSKDGAWIIDKWIPEQNWSNGKVGIYGHSYGGLTGFLVASFVPDTTHLKAVAVSGLIDDFYRGILYPGGISNFGFPVLWGAGVRPALEHTGNASHYLTDTHCLTNFVQHRGSDVAPTPEIILDTYGAPFAVDPLTGAPTWGIRQGLMNHIAGIKAPIQLGQQYQDEQTGPRGGHVLWENIPAGVPKRIQISTGRHNPNDPQRTKTDWLDCWIIGGPTASSGASCADVTDPAKRVMLNFESQGSNRLPHYFAPDWPLPDTGWSMLALCANGQLVHGPLYSSPTQHCDGEYTYLSTGAGRHMTLDLGAVAPVPAALAPLGFTTGLPDTARYTLAFTEDTAIAGPLELSLWATLSSPDNNFWAEILDRDSVTGDTTFVQRGMLRAMFNATFDPSKSQRTPDGDIYRPYYGYQGLTPIVPLTPTKYEIEIFPIGHVWRAGHELVLQLHAPPLNDPLSTYAYAPTTPSIVTILQDPDHRSTLLVPFMPVLPTYRSSQPACGSVNGEVCVTPLLG